MSTASQIFRSLFDQRVADYSAAGMTIVSSHFGELSIEQVNDISFDAETRLRDSGVKKGLVKRLFSILVEALQNIRLHGERDEANYQCTYMVIGQKGDTFHVATANIILDRNLAKVKDRIEHINGLTEETLKEHYLQVLTNGEMSQKGGAGLGFITIAMKSKNKLAHRFVSLGDEKSLFELESFVLPDPA